MRFTETAMPGVFRVEIVRLEDDRGFFGRSWCADEFAARGLDPRLAQCSVSFNRRAGTLRGLHFQCAPHEEAKLVRCTRGAIFDVVADLRPDSPFFKRWLGFDLNADNRAMLYLPPGIAHGFQTLTPDTEVSYQMSAPYHPGSARGVRWNDPAFGITWPLADPFLSPRDAAYPDFREDEPCPH